MATYCSKSKWNSQQIQKQFKNKHRNDFYDDWSVKTNHSTPFVEACNAYHKNIYTNYNNEDELFIDEEYDENNLSYWKCSKCTYDNIERDLYCFICKSPFKSQITSNQYVATLADHLPSNLDALVHLENDMDELLQFAIMNSYEKYQHSMDLYTPIRSKPTREQIRRDKLKKQKQKQREKERQKQSEQNRKKREQQRLLQEKKEKERKFIAKCTEKCPKLGTVIGEKTVEFIQENIEQHYKNYTKQFKIKFILNYNLLLKFVSNECVKGNDWEFVYHGTDCKNDEGILKNGLIVGGTKGVRIAHGTCYGRGIYCSPRTATAAGYERGSMFICIARYGKAQRNGYIWVVPKETDILPIYLVSFSSKKNDPNTKPVFPYFPVSDTLKDLLKAKTDNEAKGSIDDDGLSQQVVKFIPSFCLLNNKDAMGRKIKRKWNAYYKINQY